MDLLNIQEQLNTEFSKDSTRIIFWFDDKGDYEDEIQEIILDNASLHVLDGSNWLYSKWLLNESDPVGKYLVYAPFARPSDEENPLVDLYYYSVPYYTDRVSQMSQEVGIDAKFMEHLKQYAAFWKNKNRIEKFKKLAIDHYNAEKIDIGIIAVLAGVDQANFEEVVRKLILSDSTSFMKDIETNGLTDVFWALCKKYFSYEADTPAIDDMASCMLITYAASTLRTAIPTNMRSYVLKKRNDVVVLIRNIMDSKNDGEAYDELAERIDKTLRFSNKIGEDLKKDSSKVQLADVINCDAFRGLDEIIIDWALEQLDAEMLDALVDGLTLAQIADERVSKAYHYAENFKYEYQAIKMAYLMMKSVSLMEYVSDPVQLVSDYQRETYKIDSYYRWFYYAYDQLEDADKFANVRDRIENIYSNTYLKKITPKWNDALTSDAYKNIGLSMESDFYRNYLRAYDGKERVIVIISDALRYECAKELMDRLELDEKCDAKIDCMLGVLPSVTSVGMASLLPHDDLQVDDKMNVTVNGGNCGDLLSRDKILKSYDERNAAVAFDEIYKATKARVRELLQDKHIVYIYHNQVDARGDKPASENEVFNACDEAITEIMKLVHDLTNSVSATKFIITADHGFLYKRDKIQEFDKVDVPKEVCTYTNKRFLLTSTETNYTGMMSRVMAYCKAFVTIPVGADIFKVSGGGQNYVHGGSSIQEMLVPVVEVRTATGKQTINYVDVILTTSTRKVTNLITYFDFIQSEKVTDVVKGRSLIAFFEDANGNQISYDVPIIANSREEAPDKRSFHEKFTLKSREYKYGDKYYLKIVDEQDRKNVLQSYEFLIDIAFVDDFGF